MTLREGRARLRCAAAVAALIAALVASAGLDLVGASSGAAAAGTPRFGRFIKHVVVIYQENHSFDETLGRFCELQRRCDGYTGTVRLHNGEVVAMHQSPDIVPNVWHDVHAQQTAVDGGAMDGWAQVRGCHPSPTVYRCLTYYTPAQIPNLASLAQHFVVSDRTFSMADSPSWGGHVYPAAATLDHFTGDVPVPAKGVQPGEGWGCDSHLVAAWVNPRTHRTSMEPACVPARPRTLNTRRFPYRGAFRSTPVPWVPTIFDRLDAAHLSWKLYATVYEWSICPMFAECHYGPQNRNVVAPTDLLKDAAAGRLPSLSLLMPDGPGGRTSQHNNVSMQAGDNWLGKVVNALTHSPDWNSTAVFITYDDCGCFYDHVPPGRNPDGTPQGIRVPMVIVSPYAKRTYTDSHPATFASILRFTEETFGLHPLSVNDRRAYDYRNAFDLSARLSGPRVTLRPHRLSRATRAFLAAHPEDINDPT